jgi:predicted nucleic acid-binding protein
MSMLLDASMTMTWLSSDEQTAASRRLLQQVIAEGAVVPSLWRLEVANVLRNAVRRRRCDDLYADRSIMRLTDLRLQTDGETDLHAWGMTPELARTENLTLYDAAYLELALRRALPLASCDTELLAAAARRGVETLIA